MPYFVIMPSVNNFAPIMKYDSEREMLECVLQHYKQYDRLPRAVYYGNELTFEPATIVQAFKVKSYE
jgi:hypothetical protein